MSAFRASLGRTDPSSLARRKRERPSGDAPQLRKAHGNGLSNSEFA